MKDISDELSDYESKLTYEEGVTSEKIDYSVQYDLNFDGTRDVRDITTCYGAINVEEIIYSNIKYLKHIIKSDVNFDKKANQVDCTLIEAAKTD